MDPSAQSESRLVAEVYQRLVEDLAVEHRWGDAVRGLMAGGSLALPALRRGLRHPDPAVRVGCCKVLDHHLDAAAVPELIANLAHENDQVRAWALHALACERCKEGACRPAEGDVVPIVIRMLADDPSGWVRQMAAHLLGRSAARRPESCRALERARDGDSEPTVRKIARWYTPGGPLYRRLSLDPTDQRGAPRRRPRPGSTLPGFRSAP